MCHWGLRILLDLCACVHTCAALLYRSRGQRLYACADWPVPWDLSRVSTLERHHRVRDQLERPRRKRSQRRSELRATIGGGIGMPTPLASEHHGDEHFETLQAIAAVPMAAAVTVLRVRAPGVIMEHADVTGVLWRCLRGLGLFNGTAADRRTLCRTRAVCACGSSAGCGAPERPAQHTDDTKCVQRSARRRADDMQPQPPPVRGKANQT